MYKRQALTRERALEALKKYNREPFHILHALTVEGVMRWFAHDVYKRQTRSRDDYQGAGGLNVIVLAVAFVADNEGHIAGVAFDTVMAVYFDVTVLQLGFELVGAALAAVLGDEDVYKRQVWISVTGWTASYAITIMSLIPM